MSYGIHNAEMTKAFFAGESIQHRRKNSETQEWNDFTYHENEPSTFGPWYHEDIYQWRLKPKFKRYRVGLFKDGNAYYTNSEDEDERGAYVCSYNTAFIRYLTDWIEYDPS